MATTLTRPLRFLVLAAVLLLSAVLIAGGASVDALAGITYTYTTDLDFADGSLINVNYTDVADQLQLDSVQTPFNFIWIAVSSQGTVVKIDTQTGAVLGEFRSTPAVHGLGDPSRTTVDGDGSVWVANRSDVAAGYGTIVHIGLLENGQCEDRNGNGTIDTSAGLGDVRPWTDDSGARGVATAEDECIVHYTAVNSQGTRHIAINANNDVWVSGLWLRNFDLVKGGRYDVPGSGAIIRSEASTGFGGYGGLIDPNGVIWSANPLLRWDTALPLTGPNGDPAGPSIGPAVAGTNWSGQYYFDSYGMCIDSQGNVWNTSLSGNQIVKYAPDGTYLGAFAHGNDFAQGCVVGANDHVWVAHSILGPQSTVGHILNDGTFIGNVDLDPGAGPTGVAVDAAGKIWATGYYSQVAYRIDPAAGPIGADAVTPVGAVDLTTVNLGGFLYNYSDMTGSTLIAPPNNGSWTVVHDATVDLAHWAFIGWNALTPGDSGIVVEVESSNDGLFTDTWTPVTNGAAPPVADGRYLKIRVSFTRSTLDEDQDGIGDTPVLYDLTVSANQPPDCSAAEASKTRLWPPYHVFKPITLLGVTDPDGDAVTITVDSIYQDEPVDTFGDGSYTPDGKGVGTDTAWVRAERTGTKKVPGDGRVYHITFTATDPYGETCAATVQVGVPHDYHDTPVDGGPLYDSTVP